MNAIFPVGVNRTFSPTSILVEVGLYVCLHVWAPEIPFTRKIRLLQEKYLRPTRTKQDFFHKFLRFSNKFTEHIGKTELYEELVRLSAKDQISFTKHDILLYIRNNHPFCDAVLQLTNKKTRKFKIDGKINNGSKRVFFGVRIAVPQDTEEEELDPHDPNLFAESSEQQQDEPVSLSVAPDSDQSEREDPVVHTLLARVEDGASETGRTGGSAPAVVSEPLPKRGRGRPPGGTSKKRKT